MPRWQVMQRSTFSVRREDHVVLEVRGQDLADLQRGVREVEDGQVARELGEAGLDLPELLLEARLLGEELGLGLLRLDLVLLEGRQLVVRRLLLREHRLQLQAIVLELLLQLRAGPASSAPALPLPLWAASSYS